MLLSPHDEWQERSLTAGAPSSSSSNASVASMDSIDSLSACRISSAPPLTVSTHAVGMASTATPSLSSPSATTALYAHSAQQAHLHPTAVGGSMNLISSPTNKRKQLDSFAYPSINSPSAPSTPTSAPSSTPGSPAQPAPSAAHPLRPSPSAATQLQLAADAMKKARLSVSGVASHELISTPFKVPEPRRRSVAEAAASSSHPPPVTPPQSPQSKPLPSPHPSASFVTATATALSPALPSQHLTRAASSPIASPSARTRTLTGKHRRTPSGPPLLFNRGHPLLLGAQPPSASHLAAASFFPSHLSSPLATVAPTVVTAATAATSSSPSCANAYLHATAGAIFERTNELMKRDHVRQRQIAALMAISCSTLSPMLKGKYKHTKVKHVEQLRDWCYQRDVKLWRKVAFFADAAGLNEESLAATCGMSVLYFKQWLTFTLPLKYRLPFDQTLIDWVQSLSHDLGYMADLDDENKPVVASQPPSKADADAAVGLPDEAGPESAAKDEDGVDEDSVGEGDDAVDEHLDDDGARVDDADELPLSANLQFTQLGLPAPSLLSSWSVDLTQSEADLAAGHAVVAASAAQQQQQDQQQQQQFLPQHSGGAAPRRNSSSAASPLSEQELLLAAQQELIDQQTRQLQLLTRMYQEKSLTVASAPAQWHPQVQSNPPAHSDAFTRARFAAAAETLLAAEAHRQQHGQPAPMPPLLYSGALSLEGSFPLEALTSEDLELLQDIQRDDDLDLFYQTLNKQQQQQQQQSTHTAHPSTPARPLGPGFPGQWAADRAFSSPSSSSQPPPLTPSSDASSASSSSSSIASSPALRRMTSATSAAASPRTAHFTFPFPNVVLPRGTMKERTAPDPRAHHTDRARVSSFSPPAAFSESLPPLPSRGSPRTCFTSSSVAGSPLPTVEQATSLGLMRSSGTVSPAFPGQSPMGFFGGDDWDAQRMGRYEEDGGGGAGSGADGGHERLY